MMNLHAALVAYVLTAMCSWLPPRHYQEREYREVAEAIVEATSDPEDEIQLAAIGSLESGYSIKARGKLGEVGVWQILSFPRFSVPKTVGGQARMALYRWKTQGMCGYTGEARQAPDCPLAYNRYARAVIYSYAHPFVSPVREVVASR